MLETVLLDWWKFYAVHPESDAWACMVSCIQRCVDVAQHANTSMHLHAWPHVCPVGPAHEVGDAGS